MGFFLFFFFGWTSVLAIIGVTANKNDIPTSVGDREGSAGLSHVMEWK